MVLWGSNLPSFHPSQAVAGGGVGVLSPLVGGGSEVDLVMDTCTRFWFPWVPGVEPFTGDAGIVEVFCWVLSFVIFWRVSGPLGLVLKFVSVKARVDVFFAFVLGFSFYLYRSGRSLYLSENLIVFVGF